ncbi:TetR/AcrR family transcriptional regulator [Mycobacterium sp. URHB0044]|uniref:TetR/AcrR family transcriptional regulator n=1 Tax=Mycobacterium sp. URHB0044 TaxID=1380386 RepID=UPI00048B2370|nr:TetR/AcrR family transcriptional regulator [Mycobacterium sp. URHB0044]
MRVESTGRRVERRDAVENREKILRTAAEVIARRGQSVPLKEIADAAGVGVGTFYRHFPDRDALLDALQRRGCDLLLDTLARIKAEGMRGVDAIEAYLKECLAMSDELVAMPLRGVKPLTDDDAVDAKRRITRAVEGFVREGKSDGTLDGAVRAIDVIVFSTLLGSPLPHGPDWATAARRQLRIFVRGIRTAR